MYITFSIARFNYEKLNDVLPKPTAIIAKGRSVTVTYHFGQKIIGGKQIMRVGLIKKSIEAMFDNQVSWLSDPLPNMTGDVYGIDAFYHDYCKYKTYPKWRWVKHRKQLVPYAMNYAQRLHENGLFCFETVLGYMYIQNQRMKGKISKFEVLEKKARWVMSKTYERIERGDFKKLDREALAKARAQNVALANKASTAVRQSKVQQRQQQVQQLLNNGVTDIHSIAGRLNVTTRTIYNDMKALKVRK